MAGIYLHIPFCKQACVYCNFHFSTSLKQKERVMEAMMREITMRSTYLEDLVVDTIYFGGGTPSLLSSDDINRITDALHANYKIGDLKEVTLEANPDDLNTRYLKSLRNTPVNRLSIGIQSFRDQDLTYMHRAHNESQADYAIKASQDTGLTNITIDLIYGIPGLSDQAWIDNLNRVGTYGLPHFSAYALTVEPKTALHYAVTHKKSAGTDPGQSAGQFEILMDRARQMGFDHYEISNFGLPGFHAVHNTNYWMGVHYLGIGPGAHSFNGKSRQWNVANNALYATGLLEQDTLNMEKEQLSEVDTLNEYIMTSLRTMWGMDMARIENQWGSIVRKKLDQTAEDFLRQKMLVLDGQHYKITDKGKLFADRIASDLFFSGEDDEKLR